MNSTIHNPTWEELKSSTRIAGSRFFDEATMAFFASRTVGEPRLLSDGRVVFATSERDRYRGTAAWGGQRRYSVRVWDGKTVSTVGDFGSCDTRAEVLRRVARFQ